MKMPDPTAMYALLQDVKRMRNAQSQYFKNRDNITLNNCKALERKVDAELAELLDPRPASPSLFDAIDAMPVPDVEPVIVKGPWEDE